MKTIHIEVASLQRAFVTLKTLITEDRPLPHLGKWRLACLYRDLEPKMAAFEERRMALLQLYGEPVPNDPNLWNITNQQDFNMEFKKILEDTIEMDIQPIPITYLDAPATVTLTKTDKDGNTTERTINPLTIAELLLIGPFIEE